MVLYVRMLFNLLVSLYTSRVILIALGIEDYGIYNVVGGLVALFSSVCGTFENATSRFLTYELGAGDVSSLRRVFANSIFIHLFIGLGLVVISELLGYWFLTTWLNLPSERMEAAKCVFHTSLAILFFRIVAVPFGSLLIANERLGSHAVICSINVSLKLLLALLLPLLGGDKLVYYSILMMGVTLMTQAMYIIYAFIFLEGANFNITFVQKDIYKSFFSFTGFVFVGQISNILFTQGVNILLNIFFGPVVNAARAVAVQVQAAIQQFSGGIQQAVDPQITKSYARHDFHYMRELIYFSSKYTFLLMFLFSFPIFLETEQILMLWLKVFPEHTVSFIRIILWITFINGLSAPLISSVYATGNIKCLELLTSSLFLAVLPLCYVCLSFVDNPDIVFIISAILVTLVFSFRLLLAKKFVNISLKEYLRIAIVPSIKTALISSVLPIIVYNSLNEGYLKLFFVLITCLVSMLISIYFIALTKKEQMFMLKKINIHIDK